jgi:hypothetical protein
MIIDPDIPNELENTIDGFTAEFALFKLGTFVVCE